MGLNFLTNQGIGSYSGSQSTSAQHSRYTCDNRTGAGLNFANMSDTVTAPCDEIGNEDGLALGRVCFLTASRDAGDGGGEEDMLECEKTTYQNDSSTNTVEHTKQFATLDTVGFDDLENDDCGICATESVDDKYQTFEVTEGRLSTLSTAMYVPVNDDGMAIQNGGSFEIHNEVQSFPDNLVPGNGLLENTVPVDSPDDNVAETYAKPQNGFSTGTLAPSSLLPALPLWPMPSKQGRGRQKAFHCKSCQLQVESEAELVQHFRTHGDRKLQIEEQAERMNLDSGNVPSHTADGKATGGNGISSMPRGPIRCEECGYNTSRYDHYLAHLKHHEQAGGVKGTLHVLSCTLCPYSTVSRYHWKKHLRNHFPCKVYTCSECSYFSDRKNNYLQHMRTHTGERPYCCPHCSYRSSQKTHLTRHMRVHSGEKPFKCMQCSYVAANQHEVTRHFRQVHNGPKPFGCEHCNYRTADRSNYKKHVELHTRPRQFHCPVCHYAASKKCNLQYHIRSKHPDSNLVTMDVSHVRLRGSSRGRRGVGMSKTGIESKVTVASNTEDDVESDFKDSEKGNCDADHMAFVKKYNDDADDGMVVGKEKADADEGRAIDKDKSDVKDGAVLNEGKSDVEMGTPVHKGKSNVGMGILVGKGKRHVEKRTLVGKGKSDIGKGTTMGKGRSDVGKGTPVRKSKSGKGTPVGKGKSDLEKSTPVEKGKSDVDKGTPVGKGKSNVDKGTPVGKGKSDVDKDTPVGKGKSNVGMGTPVGKGKNNVEMNTPVGKGKSDVDKVTPVGKGKDNVEMGTPVGKGKDNVEMGTPVGKGKSDVDKGTPVGKGKSNVDKGTPVGKGKSNVGMGTPVGKGKSDVDKGTPVGKGKSNVGMGTPVGKGKNNVKMSTPVGKGKDNVEMGTPVGKGKSDVEKGTPVGKGKSDVENDTPVGKGKRDVEMGTPVGKGKSSIEKGTPVGKGKSSVEKGTPVGKGKGDVEKCKPVGQGKSDVEKGTPVGEGESDLEKGTPVGKSMHDVEKGTPVGKGMRDVEKGTPVGQGKSDVEKGTPVGKGESGVEKGTPVGKGMRDVERIIRKSKSNLKSRVPIIRKKCLVKRDFIIETSEGDVTIADGSDTMSRNNTNSVEGNVAVTDESESDVDESVFSAGSREGDVEAGVCVTKKKERDKDSSVVMVKRKEEKPEGGANALRSEVEVESSKVDKNTQFKETGDGAEQGRTERHGKQISISIEGRGGEAQKNLKIASLSPKEIMTGEQDAVARPNEGSKRKSIDQKSNNMRTKDASRQHGVNIQGRDKREKVNDVTKEGDAKSSQNPDVSKSEFKECGGKLESLQGSAPRKPDTCKRHMRQKHVCAQQETSCVDGVASKREVLLEQTEKHVDQKLALCLRNNRSTGSPRKRSQQTIATEIQRSILPKRLKFSSPVTLIDLPPTEKPFVEWRERAGLRNNLTEQQVSLRGQQECCNTGSGCLHFGNSLGSIDNASTVGEGRKMKLVAERVTKDGLLREEVELPNSSTEDSSTLDVECFASMSPEFACALRLRMVCRPRDETGIEGDSLAAAQTKDLDGPRVHGGEAVTPLIPNSEKVLSLRMTDGAIRPVFSERTSEDEGIDSDTESDSLANRCRRGLFTDGNDVIRETDQTTRVNFHPGMIKQAICDGVASGGQVSCAGERKRSMCTETQHADLESLGLSDRRPKGEKAGCPSCVFCNMPFPSDKELGHHLRRHLFNVVVT